MTSPSREAFDAAHCRNPADCQSCDGTGSGGFGIGCTDCLGTGREPCRAGCAYPLCNCDATAAAAIGGPRYEREAFAKYIAECDQLAIVPDAAGAFNWAWQSAIQHARDVAVMACEERLMNGSHEDTESASKLLQHSSTALTERHYRTRATKLKAVR